MAGDTNFPTALDSDSSLFDVTDNVTAIEAAHHNNLKEAMKAVQAKIGVRDSSVATSLDYRLGHPTGGHAHSGATGQGPKISYNDLLNTPTIADSYGIFEPHPTFGVTSPREMRFATAYEGFLYAPYGGTVSPTAWEQTFLYVTEGGDTGFAGHRYMEFGLNNYNPGGPNTYSKFFFFGGWGVVLPIIATSAIHATYSEKAQMYFDDQANKVKIWTGATWRSLAFE